MKACDAENDVGDSGTYDYFQADYSIKYSIFKQQIELTLNYGYTRLVLLNTSMLLISVEIVGIDLI